MARMRGSVVVVVAAVLSGCIDFSPIENAVKDATQTIDRAIADINANSAAWQEILQRAVDELPDEINSSIRNEAQTLVARSIAVAGVEFRCDVDFLGQRVIVQLERLKAWLASDVEPPDAPPSLCQVAPDRIDLKAAPDAWAVVTFAGYDLDHRDANGQLVQVGMVTESGSLVPLEENRIGRTTHYVVTVNLRGLGRDLIDEGIVKLRMGWGDQTNGFPEVVVLRWEPTRRTEIVRASSSQYTPPHTRGDGDFDTTDEYPMSVKMTAELRITDTRVESRVAVAAEEVIPDYTTVAGTSAYDTIYEAPSGYRIVSVSPDDPADQSARITEHGDMEFPQPAGEVVTRFRFWGDREGLEAGTYTKIQADWAQFMIVIEETAPAWLQ